MKRNTIKEMKEILDAIEQGKIVQWYEGLNGEWIDSNTGGHPNFSDFKYRIKPEEPKKKLRPFKDTKEMFENSTSGYWLKVKDSGTYRFVLSYNDKAVQFNTSSFFTMTELLSAFTFADGTPCGIEEDA